MRRSLARKKGGEKMKKEISPAAMAVIVVCVLALAGFFLFRAATDKPSYPGMGVGPGGGAPMTREEGMKMMGTTGIPGAPPGTKNPFAGGPSDPNAKK
jgi:hypothetical protein